MAVQKKKEDINNIVLSNLRSGNATSFLRFSCLVLSARFFPLKSQPRKKRRGKERGLSLFSSSFFRKHCGGGGKGPPRGSRGKDGKRHFLSHKNVRIPGKARPNDEGRTERKPSSFPFLAAASVAATVAIGGAGTHSRQASDEKGTQECLLEEGR